MFANIHLQLISCSIKKRIFRLVIFFSPTVFIHEQTKRQVSSKISQFSLFPSIKELYNEKKGYEIAQYYKCKTTNCSLNEKKYKCNQIVCVKINKNSKRMK